MTLEDQSAPNDALNDSLWSNLLRDASSTQQPMSVNVLVLGDSQAGKKSIAAALTAHDPLAAGDALKKLSSADNNTLTSSSSDNEEYALSYHYSVVRDDEGEDPIAKLGVFKLAGNPELRSLIALPSILSNGHLLVLLVLDWTRPHLFLSSFHRWMQVLREVVTQSNLDLSSFQEQLANHLRDYKEPSSTSSQNALSASSTLLRDSGLPLPEGCLSINIGIPVVVVCHKSDHIFKLEKEKILAEAQLDFIQQALRVQCLQYGAALFYTTKIRPETLLRLREYILYRILNGGPYKQFLHRPQVVEKDIVMIPAGWDSYSKIRILSDSFDCNLFGSDQALEAYDVLQLEGGNARPTSRLENTIAIEDEQVFLEKQSQVLGTGTSLPQDDVKQRLQRLTQTLNDTALSPNMPTSTVASPSAASATPSAGDGQNAVLANFFQSLLNKKTSGTSTSVKTSRSAAAAELDKLRSQRK